MSRRMAVIAIAATAVLGLAVSQAPAGKKHSHGTLQVFVFGAVSTPPGTVNGATAFCPANTVATGGGAGYVGGIADIQMGFGSSTSYFIIVDNFDSAVSATNEVQVACTAGTTRAKGRVLPDAAVEQKVDRMAAEMEAAHRAAER